MAVSIQTVHKEILDLKKDIDFIKKHIIDPDTIMTVSEAKRFEQSMKELENGKTTSLSKLKEEFDLWEQMFNIEFSSAAKKFLKKAEKHVAKRLLDKVEELSKDPFPQGVKRVLNRKEKIFRIRLSDYRIQYSVFYEQNLIFITDIDKRPKAY